MIKDGVITKRFSSNKVFFQMKNLIVGTTLLLVLYFVNETLTKNSVNWDDFKYILIFYGALLCLLCYFWIQKQSVSKTIYTHPLYIELESLFHLNSLEDLSKLDDELVKELKRKRQFMINNQFVGTEKYMLCDYKNGQFHVLPVEGLKHMTCKQKKGDCSILFAYNQFSVEIVCKNQKEAIEIVEKVEETYSILSKGTFN